MLSLWLTALLLLAMGEVLLTFWKGYNALESRVDTEVVGIAMERTWSQDIHSSVVVNLSASTVALTLVDGTQFRYWVNTDGQLVRVQNGGGTSVLAVGVKSIRPQLQNGELVCSVLFDNGVLDLMEATPVASILTLLNGK